MAGLEEADLALLFDLDEGDEDEEENVEETVVKKGRGAALDRLTCLPHDALLQVRYI